MNKIKTTKDLYQNKNNIFQDNLPLPLKKKKKYKNRCIKINPPWKIFPHNFPKNKVTFFCKNIVFLSSLRK